ncbi:hypothetical protein HA402_015581 [Bradysia odoriphaga]|nr:hypothetical protein HA402_015581 [Bradysia odoriphaga]
MFILSFLSVILWTSTVQQSLTQHYQPTYIPFDRSNIFQSQHEQLPDLKQSLREHILSQNFTPHNNQETDILIDTYEPEEDGKRRLRRHDVESSRLLSSSAFSKISETLGALNTVGRFLVNMTRGQEPTVQHNNPSESVPDAILTLSKTVLGQNVTKTIEPLIKGTIVMDDNFFEDDDNKKTRKKIVKKDVEKVQQIKPKKDNDVASIETTTSLLSVTSVKPAQPEDVEGKEGENRCTTPQGRPGRCEDLSVCPELLLNLGDLRDSLCFKRLFIPGVCCPTQESTILTTQRPTVLTLRPPIQTTQQSLILTPYPTTQRPTQRPLIPIQPISRPPPNPPTNAIDEVLGNYLQADDCGQQEHNSGRIVGGIESASGEWPWVAAIFLHGAKRTEFWCGGSLIGSKYVLTAAHCTRDSKQKPFAARQFTVRLGDIDLSTDKEPSAPVTFKVTEVRTHPRFSRVGFYNDIAVLVLDRAVRKSKYVIPVCLPKIGHIPPPERLAGRRATVVGWGTTYYGGKESTIQRQADLPIWRNEDCNRAYFQPITENFLCAGYSEGGVDACQGDSGGPLMMRINQRWTQLGIVSFGNKCGEPGYPGVYTRLSEYTDWIQENTIN